MTHDGDDPQALDAATWREALAPEVTGTPVQSLGERCHVPESIDESMRTFRAGLAIRAARRLAEAAGDALATSHPRGIEALAESARQADAGMHVFRRGLAIRRARRTAESANAEGRPV